MNTATNIEINIKSDLDAGQVEIDQIKFKKMIFLYNALDNGWSIKKKQDSYIFTKNHEGKKEIFDETYLETFIKSNFDINKFLLTSGTSS
jgi:hypothetical protein